MPAVIVSPYDAELFGHWWFEGPQWIYYVLREVSKHGGDLALGTPGEYLKNHPVQQKATPAPSVPKAACGCTVMAGKANACAQRPTIS